MGERQTCRIGISVALLAVSAAVTVPLGPVPLTLQTMVLALLPIALGWRTATCSMALYLLLGAVGLPVFSGFSGGLGHLLGPTGGFLWGFLFLSFFAGAGTQLRVRAASAAGLRTGFAGFFPGLIGLFLCHALGTAQFAFLGNMGFLQAAALVSVPYLVKDVCSLVLAFLLGGQVRRQLYRASFLQRPVHGKKKLR